MFKVLLAGAVLLVIFALIGGWVFMLLLGAAHSYDEVIPALSYGGSFFTMLALSVATSAGAAK